MRYFPASLAQWTEGRGYRKRALLREKDLGIPGSFIQEVSFTPGDRVPLHFHRKTKEIFIALDEARFEINGNEVVLHPEDVLICEPGDVHGNPVISSAFRILVIKVNFEPDDTVWTE